MAGRVMTEAEILSYIVNSVEIEKHPPWEASFGTQPASVSVRGLKNDTRKTPHPSWNMILQAFDKAKQNLRMTKQTESSVYKKILAIQFTSTSNKGSRRRSILSGTTSSSSSSSRISNARKTGNSSSKISKKENIRVQFEDTKPEPESNPEYDSLEENKDLSVLLNTKSFPTTGTSRAQVLTTPPSSSGESLYCPSFNAIRHYRRIRREDSVLLYNISSQ